MLKKQLQRLTSGKNQAGFTIIESLVAVIVLGILMAAIAPTIVLSTATRVQSRRVELATQAARAYIDGVKSGNIPAPPISDEKEVDPPQAKLSCSERDLERNQGYCSDPEDDSYQAYCMDGDGDKECQKDNPQDLIVQAFGYNPSSTDSTRGYRLNIRVYRADAFKDRKDLESNFESYDKSGQKATQSTFTGGIGKRKAPLVEMTTEIGSDRTTFQDFCSRLEDTLRDNDNSKCSD